MCNKKFPYDWSITLHTMEVTLSNQKFLFKNHCFKNFLFYVESLISYDEPLWVVENDKKIFNPRNALFTDVALPSEVLDKHELHPFTKSYAYTEAKLNSVCDDKYYAINFHQWNHTHIFLPSKEELNIDPMVFPTGFALSYNACGPSFVSE